MSAYFPSIIDSHMNPAAIYNPHPKVPGDMTYHCAYWGRDHGLVRRVGLLHIDSARRHTGRAPRASAPWGWTAGLTC